MTSLTTIEVEQPWFNEIISGRKPIEGRKKSPTWAKVKIDQKVVLKCTETGEERFFRITHINEYPTLKDYLIGEGLNRALPEVQTLEQGIEVYKQWSTEDELKKYPFLAIGLTPC